MHRTTSLLLLLIVARTTSFFAGGELQPQHHHGGGCFPAERAALFSFKMVIMNDSTNLLGSWHGKDFCRWRGVKCSNQTGHVVRLNLRNLNPDLYNRYEFGYDACDDVNALIGKISPSRLSLKNLEHNDLSMNCFLGPNGHIPDFWGSTENLRYFNLSGIPYRRVPSRLG